MFAYWFFILFALRMTGILTPALFSVIKEEYQNIKNDSEKGLQKSGEKCVSIRLK